MSTKRNSLEELSVSASLRSLTIKALGLSGIGWQDSKLGALARLASDICDSSRAAFTILVEDELWVESSFNFPVLRMPIKDSICIEALKVDGLFEVEDLSKDERFSSKPFVLNEPKLRFYAGAPLTTKEGVKIGFLCVLGSRPKKLSAQNCRNLEVLADQAMFIIESWKMAKVTLEAQLKLEESQIYQRAVIDNVPSMIYIKNAQKKMTYSLMNLACQRLFNVSEAQFLGKNDSEFLPLKLADHLNTSDLAAFSAQKVVKIENEELPTRSGQRHFTIYKVPIFDEQKRPKMLVVIMRDITEEVKVKADLEKEKIKFVHNAKLASIGEVTAGVAHEINNPLTVIAGTILLLENLKHNPEKFGAKIKVISRSVERITKIVKSLKKFSRYNENTVFELVPVSNIIKEALEMLEAKANILNVAIKSVVQIPSVIFCSELEIEQVVVNLVSNAMDAIKNLPEKWVEVSTFDYQGQVILRVQDSGPGISPEVETKLFEPFFTTKPKGEGTGLGLSISKDILGRHQASIKLNRDVQNTCFEIVFPKAQVKSNAAS